MTTYAQDMSINGFPAGQQGALKKHFAGKPDIAKIGIPDAETNADAIKLANACKARLNELIEALKA